MHSKENKKQLWIFAWASFFNDFGSDIIYPLWPVFITSVLGADMAILGLIDGLGDAVVSVSQAISGYLADKSGKRKPFIWIGYGFAALSRVGYALSKSWHGIIPFRVLDRAGKMRGSPRDAIIAEISDDNDRGKNFGILRMMDNLGAVCGIACAIILFRQLGYQKLFFLAAIPSVISAVLVYASKTDRYNTGKKIFKGISFKDFNRDFRLYLTLSALFSLASFSYSFLLIYARQLGFTVVSLPLLYLLYNLTAFAVSIPFGKLADRLRRKPVLIISFIFWLAVCAIFLYLHSYIAVIFAFILYGLHLGAIEPTQRALVSELAKPELRASTLGGFKMITGLCALPSSLFAGLLWDRFNPAIPFYFSAALTLMALMLIFLVKEPDRLKPI